MTDDRSLAEASIQADIRRLWSKTEPCEAHFQLEQWGIEDPGPRVRLGFDTLVIPLQTVSGSWANLALIRPCGRVDYVPGAETENVGFFFFDPKARRDPRNPTYLCGDWPTGFSIHDATGLPVFVVFGRSGLRPVAKALRQRFPRNPIVVAATNERWAYEEQCGLRVPNPGFEAAKLAAEGINGFVAVPDFEDLEGQPTTFNDLWVREGPKAVRRYLRPHRQTSARYRAEGHDVLDHMQHPRDGSGQPVWLHDLLYQIVTGSPSLLDKLKRDPDEAGKTLASLGVKVGKGRRHLYIANKGTLAEHLDGRWPDGRWRSLLRELPGVEAGATKHFPKLKSVRTTQVPLNLVFPVGIEPQPASAA